MPENFKVIFNKKIRNAHWHNRKDKYFELRCRIDGVNYCGTGKTEQAAVENFIKSLYKNEDPNTISKNIKFENYVNIWLETVKRPNIKENTYKMYKREIESYLFPAFADKKLTDIKQFDIQNFINSFKTKDMAPTAYKLYAHLKAIFEYAIIDGIIQKSPMAKIVTPRVHTEHGTALTRSEEKILIDALKVECKELISYQALAVLLYTGMRRSELATAKISGNWVIINCAKQRSGDEKIRKVPITPMLKKVLEIIDFESVKKVKQDNLNYRLKKLLPGHHPHDLRHTFITRCQECDIRRELVSLWAGHTADSSITSTVYTHFEQNVELQLKEAKKLDYML